MLPPSVAAEPPPGWLAVEIARPALGGGSGATLTQWRGMRSPATGDVLLLGCVATPIPGWVEEMRPAVEARTLSFAASSAGRIVGVDVEARGEGGRLSLRPVGASDDLPRVGVTRTLIGWSRDEVVSCFATCATPEASARRSMASRAGPEPALLARPCDASVDRARLEGSLEPPPPGLSLGAVAWAVHHPSRAVLWGGALALFVGVVAVLGRRRPRSRI